MKKILIIAAIALAVCVSACKSSEKSAKESQNLPLTETHWVLTAINGVPVSQSPAEPTIAFDNEGKVSGSLGCNSFFGTYYAKKDKLNIEYTGATKRLCSDMKTEREYISAIQNDVHSFTIEGDVLIIKNKTQEVLRFKGTAQKE